MDVNMAGLPWFYFRGLEGCAKPKVLRGELRHRLGFPTAWMSSYCAAAK